MANDMLPFADALPDVPHPRETRVVFGHDNAQADILASFNADRMHHAWMLTGPRGIGIATLAYRVARFLLATPASGDDGLFGAPPPPETLDIGASNPVHALVESGAHPGLFVLRRGFDETSRDPKLKTAITVGEARKLKDFLGLSAADGGYRVVIVDAADEMNPAAANAILKLLEEPPKRTTFLLICPQPSRLLQTIRSRCRSLALAPLNQSDLSEGLAQAGLETPAKPNYLGTLAGGSIGRAATLIADDGLGRYDTLVKMVARAPGMDQGAWLKLGESFATRAQERFYALFIEQVSLLLSRIAKNGIYPLVDEAAAGERVLAARLSPDTHAAQAWATLEQEISARLEQGRSVNLDPPALVLDTGLKIAALATRLLTRGT